jgi:hypothetical protein
MRKERIPMTNNSSPHPTPRWTFWAVVRKKPIKFLALTLLFTYLLLRAVDPLFVQLIHGLGIKHVPDLVYILIILAAFVVGGFLSGTVLKLVSNFTLKRMEPGEAQKLFESQNHFFWSRLYGLVVGYLVLAITANLSSDIMLKIVKGNSPLNILIILVGLAIPLLLANVAARVLNRVMIKLTGTNKQLIADFKAGRYNDKVPQRYRNQSDMDGILRTMENAEAGTIYTAIPVYGLKKHISRTLKQTGKAVGIFALILTALAVVFGMGMSNFINNEIERDMAERRAQWQKEDFIKKVADEVRPSAVRAGKKAAKDEFYKNLR